ncbi:MAG: cysteine desulfurase family protein [Pirellulales bacterium]
MAVIYLDHQSTTPVDPRVLDAMWPFFTERFGNAGSITHTLGEDARDAVELARNDTAMALGAQPREIVFTSGATESNNLALLGAYQRWSARGRHIVSVATEHKAILDPLERLSRQGADVTLLPVAPHGRPDAGRIDVDRFRDALRPDTILVSVMWANNEIGTIQPIAEIADICQQRNILFHSDATQAVGKLPIDLARIPVDLLSFSAHKFYGPKGVGGLFVRRRRPAIRLIPLVEGGGQEFGLRSGTLNVPGIVGLATALRLATSELMAETRRMKSLRDELWAELQRQAGPLELRGPDLELPDLRLAANLNVGFSGLDGQSLMVQVPDVAVSSGSACTAANPEPSHVLRALGLTDDQVRSSLRLAVGRFTTADQIHQAASALATAAQRLRAAGG